MTQVVAVATPTKWVTTDHAPVIRVQKVLLCIKAIAKALGGIHLLGCAGIQQEAVLFLPTPIQEVVALLTTTPRILMIAATQRLLTHQQRIYID